METVIKVIATFGVVAIALALALALMGADVAAVVFATLAGLSFVGFILMTIWEG